MSLTSRGATPQPDGTTFREYNIFAVDREIEDIEALASELKMSEGSAAIITARQVYRKFGRGWIERLVNMSAEDLNNFAKETGAHHGSLEGLKRKLETIADLGFVVGSDKAAGTGIDGLVKDLKGGAARHPDVRAVPQRAGLHARG